MKRDNRVLLALGLQVLMWASAIAWFQMMSRRLRLVDENFANNYMPHWPEFFAFLSMLALGVLTLSALIWIWLKPKI